jgi:hypothetical protein
VGEPDWVGRGFRELEFKDLLEQFSIGRTEEGLMVGSFEEELLAVRRSGKVGWLLWIWIAGMATARFWCEPLAPTRLLHPFTLQ